MEELSPQPVENHLESFDQHFDVIVTRDETSYKSELISEYLFLSKDIVSIEAAKIEQRILDEVNFCIFIIPIYVEK